MKQPHVVRKEIRLAAPPAQVWAALTDPEQTRKYFFGCRVFSDWQPGSEIIFRRRFLWMKIELRGTILRIVPGKLLQYSLKNSGKGDDPDNESLVTDKLEEHDGGTVLSISDDVGTAEGVEKRYRRSVRGWDKILRGLKKLVEK